MLFIFSEIIIHALTPQAYQGNSIAVVPGQDVPFSGDILFTNFHPFLGDCDFQSWNKALDVIAGLHVSRIVPEHGPLSGIIDLADIKEYLAALDARARELSAIVKDPKLMAEKLLKVPPSLKKSTFISNMNITTRYTRKNRPMPNKVQRLIPAHIVEGLGLRL